MCSYIACHIHVNVLIHTKTCYTRKKCAVT